MDEVGDNVAEQARDSPPDDLTPNNNKVFSITPSNAQIVRSFLEMDGHELHP